MINRETLKKIAFRCYEFKNGQVIYEDELLEVDLFACHARVKKGIFASIRHYSDRKECYSVHPQAVGWFRTLTNHPLLKYLLIRMGILAKYNIARRLRVLKKRLSFRRPV